MFDKLNVPAEDREDVLQESLTNLYANLLLAKFESRSSLSTYFLAIVKNRSYKWHHQQQKRSKDYSYYKELNAEEQPPILDHSKLEEVLNYLDGSCIRVLREFYFERASMKEIQELHGMSNIQSAKNKKHRCLTKLSALIKTMGLSIHDFYN